MQRFYFILILFPFLFLGCDKGPPVLFEITTESEFIVPPGLDNIRTHIFILNGIRTNIDLFITEEARNAVDAVYARDALIQPRITEFDFRLVNMIAINVWDPAFPDDKREVFFMDRLNNNNRERLPLFSSLSEVKDILLNPTFDAEVKIRFATFTPTEIISNLTMNFVANGKQ